MQNAKIVCLLKGNLILFGNLIFKEIGQEMASIIQELAGVDFQFVYTEKSIKETKRKILEETLKRKQLKKINKVVRKAEKKFQFRCRDDDDDDD